MTVRVCGRRLVVDGRLSGSVSVHCTGEALLGCLIKKHKYLQAKNITAARAQRSRCVTSDRCGSDPYKVPIYEPPIVVANVRSVVLVNYSHVFSGLSLISLLPRLSGPHTVLRSVPTED